MIVELRPRSCSKFNWLISYDNGDEDCVCILYQLGVVDLNMLVTHLIDEMGYAIHVLMQLTPDMLDSNRVPAAQIWLDDKFQAVLDLPVVRPVVDYDLDWEGQGVLTIKYFNAADEEVAL